MWIGEKFQSNPEIAGSPRNSFRGHGNDVLVPEGQEDEQDDGDDGGLCHGEDDAGHGGKVACTVDVGGLLTKASCEIYLPRIWHDSAG